MTKKQVYNFAPGPAMLPAEVMAQVQAEFLDYHGAGMSIVEISHRSKEFAALAEESDRDLRALLDIPGNYKILFLQGGATSQFAMAPMNLLAGGRTGDYLHTGIWSGKAIEEARKHGKVNVAASSEKQNFMVIPGRDEYRLSEDPAYVYYAANETIGGGEFQTTPDVGNIPLVSDMTSNILSRPIDVSRFGAIIAGAQKNIGPAGLVVVIVREDLIGKPSANLPTLYDYAVMAKEGSMYNTPSTFGWYVAGLVFKWILKQGGVATMEHNAIARSAKLYQAIDQSGFYGNPVAPEFRSRMNIPFTLADEALNDVFLKEAKAANLVELKGHRSVGGMRASMYNAMPQSGCDALIDFMRDFEKRHG